MGDKRRMTFKWDRKTWLSWLGQAALLLVVYWGVSSWQQKDLLANASPAPALRLVSLDGEVISVKPQQARKTLVYFFAPWCSVCKLSVPNLEALRQARSDEELAIYLVALSYSSQQEVSDFFDDLPVSVPVLMGNSHTMAEFKIDAFPTYYVLDEELKVVSKSVGYSSELGLRGRS